MSTKLYFGNLAFSVTNADLEELVTQFGPVTSAQVVMDRDTGRSKGFGFVEMTTPQDAQNAITALNGREFKGRNLNVSEARPREDRGGNRTYGGGGGRSRY